MPASRIATYGLRELVSWMSVILVQAYLRALLTRAKPIRGSILAKLTPLFGGAQFLITTSGFPVLDYICVFDHEILITTYPSSSIS
jgi:hypothetical protein